MSEFYTMPITTARTNSSYIVPTTSASSTFSISAANTSSGGRSLGKKISKFFRRRGTE